MEKLPMCRICLLEDVRMYVVVNKKLHELYEKLTDVPFVTENSRPMLACFFCCTKLKQCWRFWRKCLEAEELFAQMLNEDYEANPSINPGHLEFFNGFSNSKIELISIVDGGPTESETIKEEIPDVSERLDDIIDPEEHHTNKSELDNVDNSYPDEEKTPVHRAESNSEDVALMEIQTVMEDEQESIGAPVAKKPKLDMQRPNTSEAILAEQKKNENNEKLSCVSNIIKKTQDHTSIRTTKFKEPFIKTKHGVSGSINNPALSTSFPNNSNRDEIKYKILNKGVDSDSIKKYRRVGAKEKRFKCVICQHSFWTNTDLTRHTYTHTGEKPFKCNICQRSFTRKHDLKIHIYAHTGEKPFKCDICQRSFTIKGELTRHTLNHTDEKPFKCDICPRSYTRKVGLVSHIRTHTGEKPFKCDVCQRSFANKSVLVSHNRIHTGEKPFKCDICQRKFNNKSHLVSHSRTHTGEKPFKCDMCQKRFSRKINLESHIGIHTGEKHFKCKICPRSFRQKRLLEVHYRTHTGEKPFKCDICDHICNEKSNLVKHIRTHTGEKPFKCDVCQRSFSHKRYLICHIRTHTGEKLFKCGICQSSFKQRPHLTNHIRTHNGEKPFK